MAKSIDIVVPDLGDFADVEVIEILVAAGDAVEREDGLITLETDKAAMDVPAPEDGQIDSLTVATGDTVNSGDVIGTMTIGSADATDTDAAPASAGEAPAEPAVATSTNDTGEAPSGGGHETLVVPDLGDFEDVEVIEVHIAPDDVIGEEDPLVTLETDKIESPGKASFLEELIVRRELAFNFVHYNPKYDAYEGLAPWVR